MPTPSAIRTVRIAGARLRHRPVRMSFWKEVLIQAVFVGVYELSSPHGTGAASAALDHALMQIQLEQQLGLFHERMFQQWTLPHGGLVQAADLYYATMHWIAPVGALAWLYNNDATRYLRWRDAAAWTTAISFVCYALFPVTPPRLLPSSFGFVDTIARTGGATGWETVLEKTAGNTLAPAERSPRVRARRRPGPLPDAALLVDAGVGRRASGAHGSGRAG